MRRVISIAAFALILAFPGWAQRGGGHFGGAGHAGFSHPGAGFSTHVSGHFFGARAGIARSFTHGPSAARGPYLHDRFRGDRFRGDRFHGRTHGFGFRNNCYGYPCQAGYGYPWWGYDPWLWDGWDDSSNYDNDYYQNLAIANEMNQQSLNQQSLDDQRLLRQEEADGDQDLYASRRATPTEKGDSSAEAIIPPTVLVFRDQHREEIRNYAIVGETLWNFTGQRTKKIPLSDLDLAATVKANDDRGVTFTVPASSQGQ
jgi:hypothetical protein